MPAAGAYFYLFMIHTPFILYSREGEKLRADLRYEANGKKKPVVVFIHGFKGFKDWGPFPYVCEQLAINGFVSIAFNFSHNGVGDDLMEFTELGRFTENTFSRELEEISDVLGEILSLENIPIDESEIQNETIALHGHSRGAATAILAASHHRMVRAVAVWAPVSYFDRYTERQKAEWRDQRYMEMLNARTGQMMRLNVTLLDDIEKYKNSTLDIIGAVQRVTSQEKPLLIAAGSEDLTARVEESEAIYAAAVKQFAELQIIPKTGHTFGTEHPFKASTPALESAIKFTVDFFQKYLVAHPIPYPE